MRTLAFVSLLALGTSVQAQWVTPTTIVPCTPAACGGYAQNNSTMLGSGSFVPSNAVWGQIAVSLSGLRYRSTGLPVANKRFDVLYGTFVNGGAQVVNLGTVTTDANGNYSGPIWSAGGVPVTFPHGSKLTGNFMLNDPAIPNTQFITGLYAY